MGRGLAARGDLQQRDQKGEGLPVGAESDPTPTSGHPRVLGGAIIQTGTFPQPAPLLAHVQACLCPVTGGWEHEFRRSKRVQNLRNYPSVELLFFK